MFMPPSAKKLAESFAEDDKSQAGLAVSKSAPLFTRPV
jgi:hypothetical protein